MYTRSLARACPESRVGWHLEKVDTVVLESAHTVADVESLLRGCNGKRVQLHFYVPHVPESEAWVTINLVIGAV